MSNGTKKYAYPSQKGEIHGAILRAKNAVSQAVGNSNKQIQELEIWRTSIRMDGLASGKREALPPNFRTLVDMPSSLFATVTKIHLNVAFLG
jgi:hypothetical protein